MLAYYKLSKRVIKTTKLLDKKILLRVTQSERMQIQAQAALQGLSVNDYLRTVALKLPREEQMEQQRRMAELEARLARMESGR